MNIISNNLPGNLSLTGSNNVSASDYGVLHDESISDDIELSNKQIHDDSQHTLVPITTKQKLYLLLFQGVGSGLVNFIINFIIAYLMFRSVPFNTIPFSSTLTCVLSDVVVTSFLIPCLTGIIGFALLKNDLRQGKLITPIDRRYLSLPVIRWIPSGHSLVEVIKRSVMFGLIGVITFAPVTLLFIYLATGTGDMTAVWDYVAFKGVWGGFEALVVSPFLAFVVIAYADHSNDMDNLSL